MTEDQALEKMRQDIELRGLSQSTYENYTRDVQKFLAFCGRPLETLDENDARRFLTHLITIRRLAPRSVNQYSAAIRFFFAVGLNRNMNYLQMPRMKVPKDLPDVLTQAEVSSLISACENIKHKSLFLLAYGSGMRISEIISVRVKDIDSKEMRVFVKGGKNKRDHYTVLSQTTLNALRSYWRAYHPKSPEGWLFPGTKNIGHITKAAVTLAFNNCLSRTSIKKDVSPHSLRHAFGTHMYESGVDLMKIKEFLGHSCIQSTTVYVRIANTAAKSVISPADTMGSGND